MRLLLAEAFRLHLLAGLEDELRQSGFARIAGVDEVGRGCLAGPVVAAAVIADPRRLVPGVDDSKQLDAPTREAVAAEIRRTALGYGIGVVSATEIDQSNILRASRAAMIDALLRLRPPPDCAVIDAVPLPSLPFPCLPVVRGDAISYAVAAASVVAKVERDRLMTDYDRVYPQYGFSVHKGYAVPEHRRAIAIYGPSPIHRLTFGTVVPRATEPEVA
jgi:ribonuclease HII